MTGWGRLTEKGMLPHILQMVTLPFIPTSECHQMYRHLGLEKYLHKCQICNGREKGGGDSCQVIKFMWRAMAVSDLNFRRLRVFNDSLFPLGSLRSLSEYKCISEYSNLIIYYTI